MKAFVLIVCVVAFGASSLCCPKRERSEEEKNNFAEWKKTHNKMYKGATEEAAAMQILLNLKEEIDAHNKLYAEGKVSYQRGLHEHSDMSDEDWERNLLGYNEEEDEAASRAKRAATFPPGPDSIDWTKKGLVAKVENQRHCGACWAFSTAGLVNAILLKNGKTELVSPQQLVNCVKDAHGCRGGGPTSGLKYVKSNGIASEKEVPYKMKDETCEDSKYKSIATINDIKLIITNGDEKLMKDIVGSVGPISMSLCVDRRFKHYKGGVFSESNCCTKNNHAPMITGYGIDPKHGDYWIVKNSWGTSWGENGYARVARNKGNMCNIAHKALWAE